MNAFDLLLPKLQIEIIAVVHNNQLFQLNWRMKGRSDYLAHTYISETKGQGSYNP